MTFAENLFIFVAGLAFLVSIVSIKNIPWKKIGFMPESLFRGWWQVLLFNILIFISIQFTISSSFLELPAWMLDKDPLFGLFVIVFFQEIIFRGLLISRFEYLGKQKALWISIAIFVLFHIIAPYAWSIVGISFASLTLIAGYFWGWHFLKFKNIYLLAISHFLVNLSFNYVILNFMF